MALLSPRLDSISNTSFPTSGQGALSSSRLTFYLLSSLNRKRESFPNSSSKSPRIYPDWLGLSHMPISEPIPAATNVGLSLSKLTQPYRLRAVLSPHLRRSPNSALPNDTKTPAILGLWMGGPGIQHNGRRVYLEISGLD